MSEFWVTASGFQKKTLAELKTEWEASLQGIFGASIDLDPEGPFGQLVGLLSKRDADLWDGAQEIYTARNPSQATGASLDAICEETGVYRIPAAPTTVQDVILFGTYRPAGSGGNYVIPAGSLARVPGQAFSYALDSDVTLSQTAVAASRHTLATPQAGYTYLVILDGEYIVYSAQAGDDIDAVFAAWLPLFASSAWAAAGGVASRVGNQLYLDRYEAPFAMNTNSTTTALVVGQLGNFTATESGANYLPASALTEIVTPVTGWLSVTNPLTGTTGTAAETDAALRIRRAATFRVGKATEDAILYGVLNDAPGIVAASITSNRTMATDGDGRPAKSFELVVQGGDNDEIAAAIWDYMPAGVASFGNVSVDITDSQGQTQEIQFSRPTPKYIWVQLERAIYSEEDYPADGDDQIAAAIIAWALDEFSIGKDVIRQRISVPVYSVPGVGDISIQIAVTDSPSGTPIYAASDIAIAGRELAEFDAARISVGDL